MYEFPDTAPRQRVYILRLWETRSDLPDASATWRFSTQDPQTGERRGFASLDSLMAFLDGQTSQPERRRGGRLPPQPDAMSSRSFTAGSISSGTGGSEPDRPPGS